MQKRISQILSEIAGLKNYNDRVTALRANNTYALRTVLQGIFDPTIKWLLPEGPLPTDFKFASSQQRTNLYSESRRLYLFVEGGNPTLAQPKREFLFLELLSNLEEDDAQLLVLMKNKQSPHKNINEKLVREAFPGLLK